MTEKTLLALDQFFSKVGEVCYLEEAKDCFFVSVPNSHKCVRVPKYLDDDLAYFVGFAVGDAGLKDTEKTLKKVGRREYKIIVGDRDRAFVRQLLRPLFMKLFHMHVPVRYERLRKGEHYYYVNPTSKVIHLFLTEVIGLKEGKSAKYVPEIIKKSPPRVQRFFVRGYWDADGGIWLARCRGQTEIGVHCRDLELIRDIKEMTERLFGIKLGGVYCDPDGRYYKIVTSRRSEIIKACKYKLFIHPRKIKLANAAVAQTLADVSAKAS